MPYKNLFYSSRDKRNPVSSGPVEVKEGGNSLLFVLRGARSTQKKIAGPPQRVSERLGSENGDGSSPIMFRFLLAFNNFATFFEHFGGKTLHT